MANKLKTLLKGSENQSEFKDLLGKEIENLPGSENVKEIYKKELFKEIVADEDYQNLSRVKKEKKEKSEQISKSSDTSHDKLLNKPNMTATDKENMEKSIKYLVDNKMDTSENLKKLEAINYGVNFIEIGGVKFSRENLVPQVQFKSKVNQYNVFESDKKGVFKTIYNGKDEYYLSTDAYIEECKNQGKESIKDDHIRKALQALPGEFKDNTWYNGANILANILNISMSGSVDADGEWGLKGKCGFLGSASPFDTTRTRAFGFDKAEGGLYYNYCRTSANPCMFVVE